MDTETERDMRIVGARDIESVRVAERAGIAMRGAEHADDLVSRGCVLVADAGVVEGPTRHRVAPGAFITQHLLHRAGHERRIGT